MPGPRTMHDIRTLRSVAAQRAATDERAAFGQIHRLACEKHRLERELEFWLSKKQRIELRLAEIEQQMRTLSSASFPAVNGSRAPAAPPGWREVTLEY